MNFLRCILSGCFAFLVVILFGSFSVGPRPVVEVTSGMFNVKGVLVGTNLLVYGSSVKGGLEVHLYDSSLNEVANYTHNFPGFHAPRSKVEVPSDSVFWFTTSGDDVLGKQQGIYKLNAKLIPIVKPWKYRPPVFPDLGQNIISLKKTDDYTVQFETHLTHKDLGPQKRVTSIQMWYTGMDSTRNFESWDQILDSTDAEFGRIFLIREGKIYLYVNYSTTEGRQFIYCLDRLSGKVLYKTKLVASFSNSKSENEYWGVTNFKQTEACIFSNYFWDEARDVMFVGGTWMVDSGKTTGLFVIQLDETGVIRGNITDYPYRFSSRTYGGQHSGTGGFNRNDKTYYRVHSMGYQKDGTFSVLSEVYAQIRLFRPQNGVQPEEIYLQDDMLHYFTMQANYFWIQGNTIKPRNPDAIVRVTSWEVNHHLDSIAGFVPKVTKMGDDNSVSTINSICDALNNEGCCIAAFRDQGATGLKVLTRETVQVDDKRTYRGYFSKSGFALNNANWLAFLNPYPVAEQDFNKRTDYFAPGSKMLFRLEQTANGFKLSKVGW